MCFLILHENLPLIQLGMISRTWVFARAWFKAYRQGQALPAHVTAVHFQLCPRWCKVSLKSYHRQGWPLWWTRGLPSWRSWPQVDSDVLFINVFSEHRHLKIESERRELPSVSSIVAVSLNLGTLGILSWLLFYCINFLSRNILSLWVHVWFQTTRRRGITGPRVGDQGIW